jgi:dienelactone hydrolase
MIVLKPVATLFRAVQSPIRPASPGGAPAAGDAHGGAPPGAKRSLRFGLILAAGLIGLAALAAILIVVAAGSGGGRRRSAPAVVRHRVNAPPPRASASAPFSVGLRVLSLADTTRAIHPNGTSVPRPLLTYVRYPALAAPGKMDAPNAPAAGSSGPFPLVVFGHGFAVTPDLYSRLLQAWARAGYVVAAPVFPLENANGPGGPDEKDLVNQPQDVSFVISSLLAADRAPGDPLAGLIDPTRIAAAGQSDGADTALAVAYNSNFRDPRVSAVISLAGAEIPGVSGFNFSRGEPPLLAAQGTADPINPPSLTDTFFEAAQPPKFRLNLLGVEHLPPYTYEQPQLHIVEGVTTAFLDRYLKHQSRALARLTALGNVAGRAALIAQP